MKKLDAIICFVLLTISELFFKFNLDLDLKPLAILLSILSFGFFVSLGCLFNKKVRLALESIYVLLWNLYLFSQNYYYLFFKNLWSVFNLGQTKELSGVLGEITAKFSPALIVYLLIIVIWFIIIKFVKTKEAQAKNIIIVLPVCFIILSNLILSYSVSYYDDYSGRLNAQTPRDYLYQEMLDKPKFVQEFGVPEYIKRDITKAVKTIGRKPTKEDIETVNNWLKQPDTNEWTGIFKDKSLIFIQAESLTNQAIDPFLTPTLYKMKTEGIYFDNFYAPLYPANTNDTEFILQTGLMPSIEGATTSYKCANNYFPYSLATLFKAEGYSSNSYHSFFGEFYNRIKFHETLGFEHFYSVKDILSEHAGLTNGLYWVDDIELAKAYMENSYDEPYYSFIISASGHAPYYDKREQLLEEYKVVKEYWKDKYNDEIAFYEATQMKLDKALEYLIEQNPDAVIVVVGDHYPYSLTDESQDIFLEQNYERYKVPFIIYSKDIEAKTVPQVRSTFDVYPTLLNLFGIEKPISFGVDALSNNKSTVYLLNGDIITDDYQGKAEDIQPWNIGKIILNTDYFKDKASK